MNSYMQKDETRSLSHTRYKTKKWTKNLNIRPETIKLLEGNSIFFNISLNNIFRTYLISQGGEKRKTNKNKKPKWDSVQSLSHVWFFATPWTTALQAFLSITNSRSLLKLMSIGLVMPSNHHILWHLLLLPSFFPGIRVFSNESALRIRWLKHWSFSFNISTSNEYSGLFPLEWTGWISLQSKGLSRVFSKASILRHSAFSIVQLSHPYMTTRKTIIFTRRTFVGKEMSLLFKYAVYTGYSFSSKEQVSFNFMVAVTVCSDFRDQYNEVCHCFPLLSHLFAIE